MNTVRHRGALAGAGLWLVLASVASAQLSYEPLNQAGTPPAVEYGIDWYETIGTESFENFSPEALMGLQDAKNLLYAYRFGGEAKMNDVLGEILSEDMPAKRLQQASIDANKIGNEVGLRSLVEAALRLMERAVQKAPEDVDMLRSLAVAYANDRQPELASQVQHLAIQRAPIKGEDDRARLTFMLSLSLKKRGMTTLANELFSSEEVQSMGDVTFENFIRTYGFGRPVFGFSFEERQEDGVPHVAVTKVEPRTPAAVAGLRVGDRIEKVGSTRVSDAADMKAALEAAPLDEPTRVLVRRGGGFETLELIKSLDGGMVLARNLTDRGVDLASKRKFAEAAPLFDQAREVGPRYAKAWFNTAQLALARNDAARALECFLGALALGLDQKLTGVAMQQVERLTMQLGGNAAYAFPRDLQGRNQVAVSLGQRGEHVKSYLAFLEILQDSPGFGSALLGVAFIEQTLGLRKQAADHLEGFLRAYPQAPNRHMVSQMIRDLRSPVDSIAGTAAGTPGQGGGAPAPMSFATPGAGAAPPPGYTAWGAAPPPRPQGRAQWGGAGFAPQGSSPPSGGGINAIGNDLFRQIQQGGAGNPSGASWGQR